MKHVKITLYILWLCLICGLPVSAQISGDTLKILHKQIPLDRFNRKIINFPVAAKGQWIFGLNASYTNHVNDNYQLLNMLKESDTEGYTFKINPFFAYFFQQNRAVGSRFTYERTFIRINNVSLDIDDDMNFSIKDIYYLQHLYSGSGFVRSYIGLGSSKRFGLFNETYITLSGGNGKMIRGNGESLNGTYSRIRALNVGVTPGLTAFITNNIGVEVSFGVAGFEYRKEKQIHNHVQVGERRSSGVNFKIDLFSINIGLAVYL